MNTRLQTRLLGLQLVSLLTAVGGDLVGSTALTTVGVAGFFVVLLALFTAMAARLLGGVGERVREDPPMVVPRSGR